MCDIDGRVIELSKKYFAGSTACAYTDPRLELVRSQPEACPVCPSTCPLSSCGACCVPCARRP